MRYFCALVACAITLWSTSGIAAEGPQSGAQPYFMLHVKDCSMPVCEEQVVYLRADDTLMFLNTETDRGPSAILGPPEKSWQKARPGAFGTVSQLVRALSKALPPIAGCDKVRPERISAMGTLVSGGAPVAFQFSDACANQTSGSMPYQLVREIREVMTLGVQPLQKG